MLVHILRGGRALCGREGTPNTWSVDERFIAWPEFTKRTARTGLCSGCFDEWRAVMKFGNARRQRTIKEKRQ